MLLMGSDIHPLSGRMKEQEKENTQAVGRKKPASCRCSSSLL